MADDVTPLDSAGSPDPGTGAPSPPDASSSSSVEDTRAIAARAFADSGDGDIAAPPPADPSTSPPTPDAATRAGDVDDPAYQSLLASGSMPVDRHKAVLTNARTKARAEGEQAARDAYRWVDDLKLDRARAENALGLMRALDANPEHAIRTLAHALGVTLPPPAPPPQPEGPPAPDVKLDDGSEFYSAAQLNKLHAWQSAQYDQKLRALEERYKPLVEERHLSKLREHAAAEATTTLAECRSSWPKFAELEGDIKARMVADPTLSLDRAYIHAFAAKGLPALMSQASADRAGQLQRKAAASNPGPGAARPVTPLRYDERTTRDIAAEVFRRAAG